MCSGCSRRQTLQIMIVPHPHPFLSFYIWPDIIRDRISLRSFWVSCSSCVPSLMANRMLETALMLCQCCPAADKTHKTVVCYSTFLDTSAQHSTVGVAMGKMSSISAIPNTHRLWLSFRGIVFIRKMSSHKHQWFSLKLLLTATESIYINFTLVKKFLVSTISFLPVGKKKRKKKTP